MDDVTVVITSSNRHDLLERTLDSFVRWNTYKRIGGILLFEDSNTYPAIADDPKYAEYSISVLQTSPRLGQLLAIDVAYKYIKTKYIFHCEDDWEFYAAGFIEESINILESDPAILQVHLRHPEDIIPGGELEYAMDASGAFARIYKGRREGKTWFGFSFNPGLRRLSDYQRLGSYSGQLLTEHYCGQNFEAYIGFLYKNHGYITAMSLGNGGQGFVRHTGEGRHVGQGEAGPARSCS